jgi:hypothetical protein
MFRSMVAMLALAVLIQEASAQKPPAFGSVFGFVFCTDTNTPARLAYVVLRPVPSMKANNSAPGATDGVEVRTVQTSIDGSFSIPRLHPEGTTFWQPWRDTSHHWPDWVSATETF